MFEFFVAQESPPWCQVQVDHFDSAPNFNHESEVKKLQIILNTMAVVAIDENIFVPKKIDENICPM